MASRFVAQRVEGGHGPPPQLELRLWQAYPRRAATNAPSSRVTIAPATSKVDTASQAKGVPPNRKPVIAVAAPMEPMITLPRNTFEEISISIIPVPAAEAMRELGHSSLQTSVWRFSHSRVAFRLPARRKLVSIVSALRQWRVDADCAVQ